jgi:hypothetical protein
MWPFASPISKKINKFIEIIVIFALDVSICKNLAYDFIWVGQR